MRRVYLPDSNRSVFIRTNVPDGEIDYRYAVEAPTRPDSMASSASRATWAPSRRLSPLGDQHRIPAFDHSGSGAARAGLSPGIVLGGVWHKPARICRYAALCGAHSSAGRAAAHNRLVPGSNPGGPTKPGNVKNSPLGFSSGTVGRASPAPGWTKAREGALCGRLSLDRRAGNL